MKVLNVNRVLLTAVFLVSCSSFAAQSPTDIQAINSQIVQRVHRMIEMQGGNYRPKALTAGLKIERHLRLEDHQMALHLVQLAEISGDEAVRFILLNSLEDIGQLEDTTAFERLLAFFENTKNSGSDRTAASNSIRAAGIRSGNATLLAKIQAHVSQCTNQEVLADYIFYLGQEATILSQVSWYFPFLFKNLADPEVAAQVRVSSARELGWALRKNGHVSSTSPMAGSIRQNLVAALASERDNDVRREIIMSMEVGPDAFYEKTLVRLKLSDPEEKIRSAAERALFAVRGGFENSNVISPQQRVANLHARALGALDHLKERCSFLLE